MKKRTTSDRLKQIMTERNLRQVDILEMCKPYCQKYNIKLGRNDLSQYVKGKVEPGQKKLTILGMALNVSEAWLMGFDVPMERDSYTQFSSPSTIGFEITARSLKHSPEIFKSLCDSIENIASDNNIVFSDGSLDFNNAYDLLTSPHISYEKKAIFLRTIIDFVIYDTKKDELVILYNSGEIESKQLIEKIFQNCQKLTIEGLHKIEEYSSDISSLNNYLKSNAKEDFFLNAAHENSPTLKQKNDADNIMMNDDEWK